MAKLLVVVGITGNQGGSVAASFVDNPKWRIRGLTRDVKSGKSQKLASQGVEMVQCNLHDPESLKDVFKGANLVFSITDFWAPFFDPANRARAKEQCKSIGQLAYELELEQGKNIADAVAREAESLDEVGFIASTLCSPRKVSKGKYMELWHFESKAEAFPTYVEDKYAALARKTSYLHTGYFFTSWRFTPERWLAKVYRDCAQMNTSFVANVHISYPIIPFKCSFPSPPPSASHTSTPPKTPVPGPLRCSRSRQTPRLWLRASGSHGHNGSRGLGKSQA
jgi:hypothetical protein